MSKVWQEFIYRTEKPILERYLEKNHWNLYVTSLELGIAKNTLKKKIKIHGIKLGQIKYAKHRVIDDFAYKREMDIKIKEFLQSVSDELKGSKRAMTRYLGLNRATVRKYLDYYGIRIDNSIQDSNMYTGGKT